MRHDRSIELAPDTRPEIEFETLDALPDWCILVAHCGACGHQSELDRRAISRRFGASVKLTALPLNLRCRQPCGNRAGNRLFVQKLPR